MMALVFCCYVEFIKQELPLARRNFASIYGSVRKCAVSAHAKDHSSPNDILHAADLTAVFYFKEVKCLQRSASVTRLLRKRGFPAELVIGIQQLPFRAHAWVELDGAVVNDKPYVSQMYTVIERC